MTMSFNPVRRWASRLVMAIGLFLFAGAAMADYAMEFQKPVTSIATEVLKLHNLILVICLVIFVVVFSVMFYSIIMHRKSRGHKAAKFHENMTVEVVWTIIPFIILLSMAIPSTAVLLKMDDDTNADMTVKITGIQWKWKYEYPDHGGISFISSLTTPADQIGSPRFSRAGFKAGARKGENYLLEVDNMLVLPVGKKIRFLLTSQDVIHAWWVPSLAIKKDAIPGFPNYMWTRIDEPGIYRGQCAELCGKDHGFMPIVVEAVPQKEFEKWVSRQKAGQASAKAAEGKKMTRAQLMARGKQVYKKACAGCHGQNGEGIATFPKLTGSKIVTGPVKNHIDIVLNGKKNTTMRAFRGELGKADIAAVVTYERNALGNKTGDVVQPTDIK
jgi:cytochrome c oxidase subunit II